MRLPRRKLRLALAVTAILILSILLFTLIRLIPSIERSLQALSRYLLLVGSSLALLLLAVFAMYKMIREKDRQGFLRSCFGFTAGAIIALLVNDWIRDPLAIELLTDRSNLMMILAVAFLTGIGLSEIATLTRRNGTPILVFLCSSVSFIFFELLSIPALGIDIDFLLVFLLGVTIDQMLRSRP